MLFLALLLAQDTGPIDAAAKSVSGFNVRDAKLVGDAEFLTRVTRDLWGEAPSDADAKAFDGEVAADKRLRKIDALLASPKFAAHWGRRLSTWLIGPPESYRVEIDGLKVDRSIADGFAAWMTAQVRVDAPWTDTLRAMIEARGKVSAVPELGWSLSFTREGTYPAEFAEGVGRLLGIRLYCARCHDHPFDKWTVSDFYRLAAFGVRTRVRRTEGGTRLLVLDEGEMEIPSALQAEGKAPKVNFAKGGTLDPVFLFGGNPGKNDDRLKILANLMTSSSNTQFSRAFANQVWAWIFGKGVVDPPDDFNLRNKAASPGLLDNLTRKLIEGGHRLKPFLRTLCATEIYQRVDTTAPEMARFSSFRGAVVRPREPNHPKKPFGDITLVLPPEWKAEERRHGFTAPFRLPGEAGDAVFGLWSGWSDSWAAQLAGAKVAEEKAGSAMIFDATGTYTCEYGASGPREKHRVLIGRVKPAEGPPRYFRLEGPAQTVAAWRDAFVDVLKRAAP